MMKLNYFNYKDFRGKVLLTNDLGRYVFVEPSDFKRLISGELDEFSVLGQALIQAGIAYSETGLKFLERNKWDLLNAKRHLATATSLHIFVVTTACNMNCVYCQANNGTTTPNLYMTEMTAEKAVDIALQSPEYSLSFEFQGGEPLLNFPIIKHIIEYAEERKQDKDVKYNIVSNLTLLTDEMLDFLGDHHVNISTSVDGNEMLHNMNRPFRDGSGTFCRVREGIRKIKDRGIGVGAIETTTRHSLPYAGEIIHAYLDLGFESIFIRHLTRLGKAAKCWEEIGYDAQEFLDFYRNAVNVMISLSKQGTYIQEQHASILLKRINNAGVNYMELRSPCGGGIGQMAYFADGRVFTCDEGRMMAEMGTDAFLLGNVYSDTYNDLVSSKTCRAVCSASTLETIPSCCDCVYQPYCGTCPVVNYALTGDIIEKTPRSFRCEVYSGMLDYLFGLIMENNPETIGILNQWSC